MNSLPIDTGEAACGYRCIWGNVFGVCFFQNKLLAHISVYLVLTILMLESFSTCLVLKHALKKKKKSESIIQRFIELVYGYPDWP